MAIAECGLRQLMHHPLGVVHQQFVQGAARQDVLTDQVLRSAIGEPRKLNDQTVRQWMTSQRVCNSCYAFLSHKRNLD